MSPPVPAPRSFRGHFPLSAALAVLGTFAWAGAAAPADPREPAAGPPGLSEVHARWADRLEETEAAFDRAIAKRRPRPLNLPEPLFEEGEGSRPMEVASHMTRYLRRLEGIWREEIAAYDRVRPLSDDERGLLRAFAAGQAHESDPYYRLQDWAGWEEDRDRHAAAVRAAGTDDPLVRAFLALAAARYPAGGDAADPDAAAANLRDLSAAADAVAADDAVPPLLRALVAAEALRTSAQATAPGARRAGELLELAPPVDPAAVDPASAVAARVETAAVALRAAAAALTPEAAAARPQAPRVLYELATDMFVSAGWSERAEKPSSLTLLAALSDAAEGGADPYAFHVWAARLLIARGWEARGRGYAGSVTEEGWETFGEDLAAAARHAHAAWVLHPNLPCAAWRLIKISMATGDALSPAEWFQAAVEAQIDHVAHWGRFAYALEPKWGGSLEAMCALADAAVRPGLRGTQTFRCGLGVVRQARSVVEESGRGGLPPDAWRATLTAYAFRLAADPPPTAALLADGAYGAWARELGGLASALLAEGLTDEAVAVLRLWPDRREEPLQLRPMLDGYRRDYVVGPILAARGPAAEQAALLREALNQDASAVTPEALPRLRAAVDAVEAAAGRDPQQLGWLEDVNVVLDRAEALHAGGVVDFSFRPGLPGWRCVAESYRLLSADDLPEKGRVGGGRSGDGVELRGDTRETNPYVSPLGRLPEPFFVSARIQNTPQEGRESLAGVGLGPGAWADMRGRIPESDEPTGGIFYIYTTFRGGGNGGLGWLPLPWDDGAGLRPTVKLRGLRPGEDQFRLQLLAEPGRVATFLWKNFRHVGTDAAPRTVQPVRFGMVGETFSPRRTRVDSVGVAARPDFTIPPGVTFDGLPDDLAPAAPPPAGPTGEDPGDAE